jgi:ribonuclease BN (tRNA processing enzyme)
MENPSALKYNFKGGNCMKLTVIGHWGGYPKLNEATTGYLLEHDGFKLLIDCGSAVFSNMQQFVLPEELDAVILSHYHEDHVADIGVLQYSLLNGKYLGRKTGTLPIYGHLEDQMGFDRLSFRDITEGVIYHPDEILTIGPFSIRFMKTKHPVPCYAMRIEAGKKVLVYTADSSFLNEFISFSKDADLLLCECNFYGEMNGEQAGHMTSYQAGEIAKGAKAKKLVLTHLPQFGNLEQLKQEASERFSGEVELAALGLDMEL